MNKMIVSFGHSNYCIKSGGTEKYIRELSLELQQKDFFHLYFFSIARDKKSVGVIFNDRFEGIFKVKDMPKIIGYYRDKNKAYINTYHIQHLWHYDILNIQNVLDTFRAPIVCFLHDYFFVCSSFNLINSNGNFCGFGMPSVNKCKDCHFFEKGREHSKNLNDFLSMNAKNIKCLVAPSKYVAEGIKATFPYMIDKIKVRPHLELCNYTKPDYRNRETKKLRIAYVGVQSDHKGYSKWKIFVDRIQKTNNPNIQLFYFGIGKEIIDGVTNVFVSASQQGENTMVDAIKSNKIDMVFLWPLCPETYSYVYYELLVSGVFILTNSMSGNICAEVNDKKNGLIFNTFDDFLDYVSSVENLERDLRKFKMSAIEYPTSFRTNTDLTLLTSIDCDKRFTKCVKHKVRKSFIRTLIYKTQYR